MSTMITRSNKKHGFAILLLALLLGSAFLSSDTNAQASDREPCEADDSPAEAEGGNHNLELLCQVSRITEQSVKEPPGALTTRIKMEQLNRANRFLLTPHKRNYFLPFSYHYNPNEAPYAGMNTSLESLKSLEAELQLSLKVLVRENIFGDNGHLSIAYTNHAFWQVYSELDSAPFRETNHEPELILSFTSNWQMLGVRNLVNEIILNHQSNGQGGSLSRSWNRLMLRSVFERGRWAFMFSPWYRFSESPQRYPGDPDGDDNPDIIDYMGYYEFNAAYKRRDNILSVMLRNNFEKGHNTIEAGWSFPLSANLRGYLRYFDGYGYSLIDYNDRQRVWSLGVAFADLL